MKSQEWELQSGLKFSLATPESVEEFDSLPGGRVGLCLECATDDVMYRGPFADVRDILAKAVETANPTIPRLTKPHPTDKNKTVLNESPGKYLSRVAAALGHEDGVVFQPILDKIMSDNSALPDTDKNKIKFSVEKVARTGGTSLVGRGDLELAKTLIDKGPAALTVAVDKLAQFLATTAEDGTVTPAVINMTGDEASQQLNLAKALKAYRAVMFKKATDGLSA